MVPPLIVSDHLRVIRFDTVPPDGAFEHEDAGDVTSIVRADDTSFGRYALKRRAPFASATRWRVGPSVRRTATVTAEITAATTPMIAIEMRSSGSVNPPSWSATALHDLDGLSGPAIGTRHRDEQLHEVHVARPALAEVVGVLPQPEVRGRRGDRQLPRGRREGAVEGALVGGGDVGRGVGAA